MRLGSTARHCLSLLHASACKTARKHCPSSLHKHARTFSQISQPNSSSTHQPHRPYSPPHSHANPINIDATDTAEYLRKIFPPLEFPLDVAQRMTTHVSWERGVNGHNGRLGFVGRRVLHTYLLLFLHECTLAPPSHNPPRNAPIPPSSRLRPSSLYAGGPLKPLTESYDDISEKLLNTYTLGEHVGAAWELERIMRWTPAVPEFDALKAQSPDTVLRSSGLYKVRGATVEGVVGGIFHQFGGLVAHRVFHTRVLPHVYQFGLPVFLHSKVREACERLGGEDGSLVQPKVARRATPLRVSRERLSTAVEDDRPRSIDSDGPGDVEYLKVGREQQAREKQRLGFKG
ncbi:hypothetical protein JB92DRAFT_3025210 [Gautieria morchelliformis]|nr:hypothetical protein JB92DRAFT_3025210 [Gautieria morchelliformis]